MNQQPAPEREPWSLTEALAGATADLVKALRFYSRLPTGRASHSPPDLTRLALVLPLASLIIGAIPALILGLALSAGMPAMAAGGLMLLASLLVTGALAEDGLADAADGLFGGSQPARRLEIMRDSRHGTYGVAAIVLSLLLRASAVAALGTAHPWAAASLWLGAATLARSMALWLSVGLPAARRDGLSASVGQVLPAAALAGSAVAGVLMFAASVPFVGALPAVGGLAVSIVLVLGWTTLCRRMVGGQTGDLIGALQGLIEIAVLLAFTLA